MQGIWPPFTDGTDLNATARSHSGHLIAVSDDFGKVRVLRYPCVQEGAKSIELSGHSSHVMNVKWSVADEFLLSCGGNDKTIFQWRHKMLNIEHGNSVMSSGGGGRVVVQSTTRNHLLDDEQTEEGSIDSDSLEEPGGGDEFMAVRPWLGG